MQHISWLTSHHLTNNVVQDLVPPVTSVWVGDVSEARDVSDWLSWFGMCGELVLFWVLTRPDVLRYCTHNENTYRVDHRRISGYYKGY